MAIRILVLLLLPAAAWSETWTGRVVGIHDGDTLTVLRGWQPVKVRLVDIDAPELGQAYGRASKLSLSAICFARTASVVDHGDDKYGRVLGRVSCGGADANAEQVARGMAWFYAGRSGNEPIRQLESEARNRRVGLWGDRHPVPPWEFRHGGNTGGRSGGSIPSRRENPVPPRFQQPACGAKTACSQMGSCEEALYYLTRCGATRLDGDRDGMPCESLCRR